MKTFRRYSGHYWLALVAVLLAQYIMSRLGLYAYTTKSYFLIGILIIATIFVTVLGNKREL
jgi:hypothetical protein